MQPLFSAQKFVLRFFAWSCLLAVVWAAWHDCAFAQEHRGGAELESSGFLGDLLHSIFTFDSTRLLRTLSRPEYTVAAFIALNVIVFVETGLLIGFFLPGDSLLVITGMICSTPECGWNVPLLLVTLSLSAVVGDTIGYSIGFKAGPKIFNREKSFFFNRDHLLKAQDFYEKHGGSTIILARFMPILRTFAPVVAGVGKMEYRRFLFYNIFGGVSWVVSMVLAGYFLPDLLNPVLRPIFGESFHIGHHVEKVVIVVVFLSISPGLFAWAKSKMGSKNADSCDTPEPMLTATCTNEIR